MMAEPVFIYKEHINPQTFVRCTSDKLRFTGIKMNTQTYGRHRARENLRRAGYDEIVACDVCGWNWWVHHEK